MWGNQEEPSISNTKNQQPILCEECKTKPSKYKCPGCSIRSCSLTCVNAHKKRTECTGKRNLNDVVPISQFDDNLLLSDYNMLEEVKRLAESAQRTRLKLCGDSHHFRLPFALKNLQNAAASRRTRILFHSNGMSRRDKNRSYFDNRKKTISWTIEWRFHSTDIVLLDHGVNEYSTLSSVIENHLKPGPWNHPLKQFCDEALNSLKFFIRKYPRGPRSPFRQLDINAPIRQQLANIVLLEYPVIYVFLPSHTYDFEVMRNFVPKNVEIRESAAHNDHPSPKGVTFREEEIEDLSSSDPHVLDLMKNNERNEKESKDFVQEDKSPKLSDSNAGSDSKTNNLDDFDDMDFDFEPELLNMCSDLFEETNLDKFLGLDGVLADDEDKNLEVVKAFLMQDELEEGEISE